MPTVNALEAIVLYNNNGVHLLKSNNASQAVETFQNAVKEFKVRTSTTIATIGGSSKVGISCRFSSRLAGLQNEHYFLFSRPMMLEQMVISSAFSFSYDNSNAHFVDLELTKLIVVVAIMFNLALATHKLAVLHGKHKLFEGAVKIYRLAAAVVNRTSRPKQESNYELDIVYCVIMNNLACLYSELCDSYQSTNALKSVQDVLSCYTSTEIHAVNNHFIQLDELMAIKMNCYFGEKPGAAKAA